MKKQILQIVRKLLKVTELISDGMEIQTVSADFKLCFLLQEQFLK